MDMHLIEAIPLWGIFVTAVALSFVFYTLGIKLGAWRKNSADGQMPQGSGILLGSLLGLAVLLLSLQFYIAHSLFEERNALVLEESSIIGKTYLQSGYLQEPYRENVQSLLKKYASILIEAAIKEKKEPLSQKLEIVQDKMWAQAKTIVEGNPSSVMEGLFIGSVSEFIDIHTRKATGRGSNIIPAMIWLVVIFVLILAALAAGYQSWALGNRNSLLYFLFVLAVASIITLTADLERPYEGLFQIDLHAMIDLYSRMYSSSATAP